MSITISLTREETIYILDHLTYKETYGSRKLYNKILRKAIRENPLGFQQFYKERR